MPRAAVGVRPHLLLAGRGGHAHDGSLGRLRSAPPGAVAERGHGGLPVRVVSQGERESSVDGVLVALLRFGCFVDGSSVIDIIFSSIFYFLSSFLFLEFLAPLFFLLFAISPFL